MGIVCLKGYIVISLIFMLFAGYAYWANVRRAANDATKKDYHFYTIFLIPFWPLPAIGWVSLLLLKAVAYGIFLIIFTGAAFLIRKPFILIWLERVALKIGNKLLHVHEFLFGLLIPKPRRERT